MDPRTILNVGDIVVIREDLEETDYPEANGEELYATEHMRRLRGRTAVVSSVVYGWSWENQEDDSLPRRYELKDLEGNNIANNLLWCPSMFSCFSPIADEELPEVSDEDMCAFMECLFSEGV